MMDSQFNRTIGLDLFRITAMLMITVLHVVDQRYSLLSLNLSAPQYLGWIDTYFCLGGVNCFAILTGYLLGKRKFFYDRTLFSKFLTLWIKVILWGIFIFAVLHMIHPGRGAISLQHLIKFFFPIYSQCWWYISAYLILLLFLPILTSFTSTCRKQDLLRMSLLFFVFFSFLPCFTVQDGALHLSRGFSAIWIVICFLWGATLKVYADQLFLLRYRKVLIAIGLTASVMLPAAFHLIIWILMHRIDGGRFLIYISPFCVVQAVFLLFGCQMISINAPALEKGLVFLSRNAIGIYLFQCHPSVWGMVFKCLPPPSIQELLYLIPVWCLLLAVAGILLNMLINWIYRICRFDHLIQWTISKMSAWSIL